MTYEEELAEVGRRADQTIAVRTQQLDEANAKLAATTDDLEELQAEYDAHLATHEPDEPAYVLGQTPNTPENSGAQLAPLTVERNTVTISSVGRTYDRVQFDGYVNFSSGAHGNVFKHPIFRGPATPTLDRPLVRHWDGTRDTVMIQPTFNPQTVSPLNAGSIHGRGFKLVRPLICGSTDGIGLVAPDGAAHDIVIEGGLLHQLVRWSPYAGQPDNQTHNDVIQAHGHVNGLELIGVTIAATIDPSRGSGPKDQTGQAMSAFMGAPKDTSGRIVRMVLRDGWIDGVLNFGKWTDGDIVITGNRMGRYARYVDNAGGVLKSKIRWAGNVDAVTGALWVP